MLRSIAIALAALAGTAGLFAQEYRVTISGSVTDAQGAAIPKATVVARETRTGVGVVRGLPARHDVCCRGAGPYRRRKRRSRA